MLAAGDIDGFIGPRWPRCYHEGHPQVRRLWQDGFFYKPPRTGSAKQ